MWWAGQDSNLQPDRYERPALTVELPAPAGLDRGQIPASAAGSRGPLEYPPFKPNKIIRGRPLSPFRMEFGITQGSGRYTFYTARSNGYTARSNGRDAS